MFKNKITQRKRVHPASPVRHPSSKFRGKRIFLGETGKLKDFLLTETLPKSTRQLATTLHLVQSVLSLQASNLSPPACSLISEILCVFV